MKKTAYIVFLTLTLFALAGLSACRKQEADEGLVPIRFTCPPLVEVTTKANNSFVSGSGPLNSGQSFGVYAWNTGGSYLSANPGSPNFISTAWDVTFLDNDDKGANNTYSPGAVDNFWPRTSGYDYSFAAYYPYGGAGISGPTWTSGTVGVYNFTAQSTAANMIDFCVSDIANDMTYSTTNSGYDGTVEMNFHHTLCRVQFRFVKAQDVEEDLHIKILDAKLKNVFTKGTLTATYAQHSPSPGHGLPGTTTLGWSGQNTQADYEITLNGEDPDPEALDEHGDPAPVEVELGYTQTVAASDVFLMVPDDIRESSDPVAAQQLWFQWNVDDGEPTTTALWLCDCVRAIGNPTPANIHWEANSFVTYTIVIRAKPIEFSDAAVTITSWDAEPEINGYYPIIL
ncbi:MAG: fimbrillin family protein [Bacteroidales bacterium]|nr:fimbrillin family protein [Bacteroidales bacterium]